jgi:penicillin amidase
MLNVLRWLLRAFLATCLAVAAGLGIGWMFLSRSLPDYGATLAVPGLAAPVEIVRTTHDVPHIFGSNDPDVFFALGYVHAQDRLWQMTLLRRAAQGRLSELFGPETVQTDELMRRIGLYDLAIAALPAQDGPTRDALEAYARGVNYRLAEISAKGLGRGAPEFFYFPPEIAVWQAADSIAIQKLLAFASSPHLAAEVLRARVSILVPDQRLADILPDDPGAAVTALPDYATLHPALDRARAQAAPPPAPPTGFPLAAWGLAPAAGASNAWAAAPARAAAGGALLAGDPHVPLSAPGLFYLARLDLSSGGVIGATIPGMPAMIAGRTDQLGWAMTAAGVDDADILIEKLDPEDPSRYLTPEGWKAFETRPSIVNVRGAAPVTLELRTGENGPILPGALLGLSAVTPDGHAAALAWTGFEPGDTTMSAFMGIMRAGSLDEAIAAARGIVAPAQNVILATPSEIALLTAGHVPLRDATHQTQGRMPAPGWLLANRWQGTLDPARLPASISPESGVVGNTNNRTSAEPFPFNLAHATGDTQRIGRLMRLVAAREVHTRESFIEAQLDTVSPAARTLLPLVGAELWFTGEAAPEGSPERQRQRALDLLGEWNGEMNEHLPEPLIAMEWLRVLQDRLIRDDLGPVADAITHVEPIFLERVFRDTDGASAWCDIIRSAAVESCADIARIALDEAIVRLGERYGPDPQSWRWGDAHTARHDHPVLGQTPILHYLVNIRQSTSGGDFTLMRGRTAGIGPEPFANVHAAGYRGVYDFADPDSSVFIIATGQSGHPLSRHYDDLGALWRRGDYIPMSLDPGLAIAGAIGITRLEPASD